MKKFNHVRWLYISKISLFFIQLFYVSFLVAAFILLVRHPDFPTNGLYFSVSGFSTTSVVENLIVKDFRMDAYQIMLLVLITFFYIVFMILAYINNTRFKFDNFKYKKQTYFNIIIYTVSIILYFVFATAKPFLNQIDVMQMIQLPSSSHLLNIFYILNIGSGNIGYALSNEGIIIITTFCILLFACVSVLLLIVKKAIEHKFF